MADQHFKRAKDDPNSGVIRGQKETRSLVR